MKQFASVVLIWLLTTALAIAFATLGLDSVRIDGRYLPFGNDSFYHAARILDALGERGFYQFDVTTHVPEGSWVSWSWGYDQLLAWLTQLAMFLTPGLDAMKFLVYIPVAWLAVNTALVLAISRRLGLPLVFQALAAFGFALLPLTQKLHGVGRIDHHFMELSLVLLVTWLTLRWVLRPSAAHAVVTGLALAAAPFFHHALFILQAPVLAVIAILWLRGLAPPPRQLRLVAISLLGGSLLVLGGSEPFWDGQFSMATLSWFHAYIVVLSAVLLLFVAWRPFAPRQALFLSGLVLLALLPLIAQLLLAGRFLSGALFTSTAILEVTSPLQMIVGNWGLANTLGLYSGLLLLAPFVLLACGWSVLRTRDPLEIAFSTFAVFGIALLLTQYRLNYFGLLFLLVGPLFWLQRLQERQGWPLSYAGLGAVVLMALSFKPALGGALLERYPLAGDHLYETVQPLMAPLAAACEEQPATVIAANQFGHYITYHSDCNVIANNFLLTPLQFAKVDEVNRLFHSTPSELRSRLSRPTYLLAYLGNVFAMRDGQVVLQDLNTVRERNPALLAELFFINSPPPGYTLIDEVRMNVDVTPRPVLARLYRIDP